MQHIVGFLLEQWQVVGIAGDGPLSLIAALMYSYPLAFMVYFYPVYAGP